MRALVVVESTFGNTKAIAQAVAEGLASRLEVTTVDVAEAQTPVPEDLALLLVGGPTHAFGMSRPTTRADGARQAGHPDEDISEGLREWLERLDDAPADAPPAAAFDTRIDKPHWLVGSAARGAARRLRQRGWRMAVEPESFFVDGVSGPLLDGELERAREWGVRLASQLAGVA